MIRLRHHSIMASKFEQANKARLFLVFRAYVVSSHTPRRSVISTYLYGTLLTSMRLIVAFISATSKFNMMMVVRML